MGHHASSTQVGLLEGELFLYLCRKGCSLDVHVEEGFLFSQAGEGAGL